MTVLIVSVFAVLQIALPEGIIEDLQDTMLQNLFGHSAIWPQASKLPRINILVKPWVELYTNCTGGSVGGNTWSVRTSSKHGPVR